MVKYVTVREAAERLGFPLPIVRRWVREGWVPVVRVGKRTVRVPLDWVESTRSRLEEYVAQRGVSPEEFIAKFLGAVK